MMIIIIIDVLFCVFKWVWHFPRQEIKKKSLKTYYFLLGNDRKRERDRKKIIYFSSHRHLDFLYKFCQLSRHTHNFHVCRAVKSFFFLNYSRRFYYYYYYLHSLITTILVFQHLFSKFLLPGRSLRNISDARIGFR